MASSTSDAGQLWFLDNLVSIRISHNQGQDGISVIEMWGPYGDSPPLHFHRTQDEVFHVLEGELLMKVQEREHQLSPGQTLLAPKGVPHTYRVESSEGAHWLVITSGSDFERFVRALARPAGKPTLPPPADQPPQQTVRLLTETAHAHGIEIIGPPLH